MSRNRILLVVSVAAAAGLLNAANAATLTFQQGVSGYAGTVDTFLQQAAPDNNNSAAVVFEWDGEDAGGQNFALLRFDNIFGVGPGLIAPTDQITSAEVTYNVVNPGDAGTANEVLVSWAESVTYNTFGGDAGVQGDEYGSAAGSAPGTTGLQSVDVTTSIAAWAVTPAANYGWIFRPTGGTDGVGMRSREDGSPTLRPKLTVVVNEGAPHKTLLVKHAPYLQLGDAPLANTGPGIGDTDQIVIVWQTIEAGSGDPPDDFFEVEYRRVGDVTFLPAAPIDILNTGVGTRVNRSVTITGLDYNEDYEYQVIHQRNPGGPVIVDTYPGTFRTRQPISDTNPFTFVAYGDSARLTDAATMVRFESVMARTTTLGARFVTLLGDNIYDTGTHDAYDARLDASVAPNQSAYIRNHIEFYCDGNHDSGDANSGLAGRQNYYVPVPVQGVTSPVAPAAGQPAEDNYSVDHGLVHFAFIDSTVWGGITGPGPSPISATSQANVLAWLTADLAATNQPWKVVCTHHPPKSYFGHSDTGEGLAAELVPVLVSGGVDLLLVGHSHNYQRSFPLTGYAAGNVTYIMDESGIYEKGAQVIQVVAGTGGRSIDSGAPLTSTEWLARAFGANNGGEVGPLLIEVSTAELRVKYVAADDGAVKDEFAIVPPGPSIVLSTSSINHVVFLGDGLPNDMFTVTNGGPDTLNYDVNDDAGWLSVNPIAGVSTGEPNQIDVIYDVAGLPVGDYPALITVSSLDAANSPQTITVNVTVESVSPDFNGDGDVDQEDFGHLQVCLTGNGVIQSDENCLDALLDGDSDVDVNDFGILQGCMSGANIPAERTCDDLP